MLSLPLSPLLLPTPFFHPFSAVWHWRIQLSPPYWPIPGRLCISIPVLKHDIFVDSDGFLIRSRFLIGIDTKVISLRYVGESKTGEAT